MSESLHGPMLRQVFCKVRTWAHYSLFYINDLSKVVSSNAKLFADDTLSFFVIHNSSATRNELNYDLVKINNWEYQRKVSFNPDPNKQVQEVIVSRRPRK